MAETKHTPGPWESEDGEIYACSNGCRVASIEDACLEEQANHNAYLIAAAPDLLEALIRAERKLRAYVGVCKDDKELTETVLPMSGAAIARTTGETR